MCLLITWWLLAVAAVVTVFHLFPRVAVVEQAVCAQQLQILVAVVH
jgi:hypothetical protein